MRKLVVLFLISIVTVVTQAASFKWSTSNVMGSDGSTAYSGSAIIHVYLKSDTTMTDVYSVEGTMTAGAISLVFESDSFVVGQTYSFYYTMTDADGNVFTSTTKSMKANATTTPNISFMSAGAWQTSVPEPTSGILFLIGSTMLALRRKQCK